MKNLSTSLPTLIALIITLLTWTTSWADESPSPNVDMLWHLQQSRLEINEELGVGYTSTSGMTMELYPSIQYFLLEKLSLGGTFEIIRSGEDKVLGIGPSATYYFYDRGRWAIYAGQRVVYRFSTPDQWLADQKSVATTYLGLNYFTDSKMAIGGLLATNYDFNGRLESGRTIARFLVSFYY